MAFQLFEWPGRRMVQVEEINYLTGMARFCLQSPEKDIERIAYSMIDWVKNENLRLHH